MQLLSQILTDAILLARDAVSEAPDLYAHTALDLLPQLFSELAELALEHETRAGPAFDDHRFDGSLSPNTFQRLGPETQLRTEPHSISTSSPDALDAKPVAAVQLELDLEVDRPRDS